MMPDTLMLAFQRPSDEAIACLRQFAKDNVHMDTDFEPVRELFRLGLVDQGARDMWITTIGRLVLAACDTDAADPVGNVVRAARGAERLLVNTDNYHYDEYVELEKALDELDRATDKAGEVG